MRKAVNSKRKRIIGEHKMTKDFNKKIKLANKGKLTKWAPVWIVLKKFGTGKRIHPSAVTRQKRNWRRNKLHIKPRKMRKWHFG